MKVFKIIISCFFLILVSGADGSAGPPDKPSAQSVQGKKTSETTSPANAEKDLPKEMPAVHFPEPNYKFEPTVEGVKVTHDFVVRNRGAGLLKIYAVRSTCSCTAISFPKEIPAGGEGNIRIQFDTDGYGGRSVKKSVLVGTNDPNQAKFTLTLSGRVNNFAEITPRSIRLSGEKGEKIQADIKITPSSGYFFNIQKVRLKKNEFITYTLVEPTPETPSYILHVENIKIDVGRYADWIELRTDSKIKPLMIIGVHGEVKEKSKKSSKPKAAQPKAPEPEQSGSELVGPESAGSDATQPETTGMDRSEPEMITPDITEQRQDQSELMEPEAEEPEMPQSKSTQPDATAPEANEVHTDRSKPAAPQASEPNAPEPKRSEPKLSEPEPTATQASPTEAAEPKGEIPNP